MQELKLKIRGLYTQPSDLAASLPDGALSKADNIVIDREDTAEPRRGFNRSYSGLSAAASRLFFFQGSILAAYSTNLLAYYSNTTSSTYSTSGSWTAVSGTYAPVSGYKMRSAEANQNLYLTTSTGAYKLTSPTATPTLAGAYKGLDVTAATSAAATTWLPNNYAVAYRVVWGYKDANNNLILGAPSQREEWTNSAGSTKAVDLAITIPTGVTTDWFYQVYRSASVDNTSGDIIPSDELGLVYEGNPSSSDISAKTLTISDVTPDEFRGATIYTAATQEGIEAANEQPPLARDMAVYKNHLFFANTTSKHRYTINLLAVGGSVGVVANDTITVGGIVYTAKASASVANREFAIGATGSASQKVRDTAVSLCKVINQSSASTVYAQYLSGPDDVPGKILFEERSVGGSGFYIGASRPTSWSPTPPTAQTVSGVNTSTDKITVTAHGYAANQAIVFSKGSGSAALPSGITEGTVYYVIAPGTNDFQAATTSGGAAIDLGSGFAATVLVNKTEEASTNDRYKNGLLFSKSMQPEAAPLSNLFFVGSAQKEITRIVSLRDSLFVFKEDGIYRVVGEDASSFRVDLFDSTTKLLAPDSIAVLNNQIFALTDQGVVSVSEGGVAVRSRPIEYTILSLLGINATVLQSESFGIGYETERKYILFVPRLAGDTGPTQAFVYNVFTDSWTRWPLSKACGGVNPADTKLYLGESAASVGSYYVNQERKSYSFTDYVDFGFQATITDVNGTTISMTNTDQISAGDVLYQSGSVFSVVEAVDSVAGTVTTQVEAAFAAGSVDVYKAISSAIAWAPITGGNPGTLKHFRELTLLFKQAYTGTGTLVFTSDASPSEEEETVEGDEQGLWGLFSWDGAPWGGGSTRRPIRIYVPRNKQRCSQLTVEFQNATGYAAYQLSGLSIVANQGSERVAV